MDFNLTYNLEFFSRRLHSLSNRYEITNIRALEILDSRGNPTLQVEVITGGGTGLGKVPSGASTGEHEAVALRDGDETRYAGKGVLMAINNVENVLRKPLLGLDCREQQQIDGLLCALDGTSNKSRLGANALLGVSLAVAAAAACCNGQPLYQYLRSQERYVMPVPMMNIINGAKHAGNQLAIQEFHIMPIGFDDFLEALRAGVETYHILKKVLLKKYGASSVNIGDEGGFAPPMTESREALNVILTSIEEAGYTPRKEIALAIDAAASEFFAANRYSIDGHQWTPRELSDYYLTLCEEYPLVSIEDPFSENDFDSFADLTRKVGGSVQIVGDDLFVSNPERIQRGIEIGAGNALLLKVNQIGTLTEAIQAADLAATNNFGVVVSHRSGETEDTFIADLAVALSFGQIKTGAPARSDRTAKYNRLIEIHHELGSDAMFAGKDFRFPSMH